MTHINHITAMAPAKKKTEKPKAVPKKKRVTKTKRADLLLPVGRIQRHLREGKYADRIGTAAAVYMAATLEYLVSEIFDLSAQSTKARKAVRIKPRPRDIMKAIKEDGELSELLKDVDIPYAGVIPFIHPTLLPKATKPKNNREETEIVETEQEITDMEESSSQEAHDGDEDSEGSDNEDTTSEMEL